jgi:hypothetical protein
VTDLLKRCDGVNAKKPGRLSVMSFIGVRLKEINEFNSRVPNR